MKMFSRLRVALAAAMLAALLPVAAGYAQTVTRLPTYTGAGPATVVDLGNGPTEIRVLTGNAQIFTSSSSGVASTSGSSTTLTLTATPTTANAPCVGCIVSGTGITSGTTVSAYSGLSITLSAAMTVASSTAVAWGVACPSTVGSSPAILVQAAVGADLPLYTQARICTAGQNTVGATLLTFPIGAH